MTLNPDGSFTASPTGTVTASTTYTFTYRAINSQNQRSNIVNVAVTFLAPSNLAVSVVDGTDKVTPITDYRWVIEETARSMSIPPRRRTTARRSSQPSGPISTPATGRLWRRVARGRCPANRARACRA